MKQSELKQRAEKCQRVWKALHQPSLSDINTEEFLAAIGVLLTSIFAHSEPYVMEQWIDHLYRLVLEKQNEKQ